MAECRVVLTESLGLTLGQHVAEPWSMVVVKVIPRPLEDQVWVVLAWQTVAPVPGEWHWQRGWQPVRYRTLADLAAAAFVGVGA